MKKSFLILAGLLFTLLLTAQNIEKVKGNGKIATEVRSIPAFTKLVVTGSMDVHLTSDASKRGTLTVKADENIVELITTEVKGETLSITVKKNYSIYTKNSITITVPFETLNKVSLTGSGSVIGEKAIADNIEAILNGSGTIRLTVKNTSTTATATGSGGIELSGSAGTFKCGLNGSGSIEADDVKTANAEATVTGSGSIRVNSSKALKGRITGSGSIAYAGNPSDKDLKKTGSGEFKAINK